MRVSVLLLIAAIGGYPGATPAQEALGQRLGSNLAQGRLATDFVSRLRVRTAYFKLPEGTGLFSTRFSGVYAPNHDISLRLNVPIVDVDPARSGVEHTWGLGDISARALWRFWKTPRAAAIAGAAFVFPTATEPQLGTEKYSIAPTGAFVYRLLDKVYFVPVYQQLISFAGKNERADINIVRFRPLVHAQLPRRWWTTIHPGFWWNLEGERPSDYTTTLGIELGKNFANRATASVQPTYRLSGAGDSAWAVQLSLTYLFR